MKTKIQLFILVLFIASCQENPRTEEVVIDIAKEEQAIKEVIVAESRGFWEKDYQAWADQWHHEDYVRVLGWWEGVGVYVREGWEVIGGGMKALMERNPEPNEQNEVNKNYNIRISETMAWVTFDQYGTDTGEAAMDMPGKAPNTRILEKVDGEWKIVYVGWLLEGSPDDEE